MLSDGPGLPAPAATLDELLLIVRRDGPIRFDPELGFHLYGADLCLQAAERGLAVVALGAPCRHNSRSLGLPEAFFASARAFARKWAHRLPVATPCVLFDRDGGLHLLGNADSRDGSVARSAGLIGSQSGSQSLSRKAPGPFVGWAQPIEGKARSPVGCATLHRPIALPGQTLSLM